MFSGGASSTGTISTELVSFPIYHPNKTRLPRHQQPFIERGLDTYYGKENALRTNKKEEPRRRHLKMDVRLVVARRNCYFSVTATDTSDSRLRRHWYFYKKNIAIQNSFGVSTIFKSPAIIISILVQEYKHNQCFYIRISVTFFERLLYKK